VPGPVKTLLLGAVDRALEGDWEAAHRIVQEMDDDAVAAWIHAVVHRMEGDVPNARYWYRRCARQLREDVSTTAELQEIRAALLGGPAT
jgi:phosphodiesterase/alkaline phosphatase D-like protein